MLDFTFLTKEQCDEKTRIEILKKRGLLGPITDFSFLLGGEYYNDSVSAADRLGIYWTKSVDIEDDVICEEGLGHVAVSGLERYIGVRPTIEFSSIKGLCSNVKKAPDGILEVEYGEYPQVVAPKKIQEELHKKWSKALLLHTGKTYVLDSVSAYEKYEEFKPQNLMEIQYEGKKYVRVLPNPYLDGEQIALSDNESYETNRHIWIEVLPIKWLVDEKEDIAISEKILFAGIQFNDKVEYKGEFEKTTMKKYLDEHFSNEIRNYNSSKKTEDIIVLSKKIKKIQNVYQFDFNEVSEEDLIRGSLESDLAPFLHGKSSEGKSARIKQFDPDAVIVYLRNATPDSLNGKSVYNASTGEMIDVPPTWYVKLKEKCEKEPDKLHIVFFDELTNALPSIQGMAFNIILDKEVNGIWKLPENARVAAAGNDLEDSLAANTMAEPLFNRFNHAYINTTVDDWLKWAITPNTSYQRLDYKKDEETPKIHPAIYAYISYKKESALRTKFTGEKPNADPRKWEMASKVLYKTNNPNMLRGLIGEALTKDFTAFCKTKVISIEDVIEGNYDEEIFKIDISEKYLTTLALSSVDEENLKVVREFTKKLGSEFLALFETLWIKDNDDRLEKLMDLKQEKVKRKKK